jgi:hypothetical protein
MIQRIAKLLRIQPPVVADEGLLLASGASVPSAVYGYQPGALFQDTTNGVLYVNEGTLASCTFAQISALTAAQEALLGATAGTVAASKCVIVDAYKTLRWGGFNTSAALTDAVPFASVPNTWSDGQLDVLAVFGGCATNLGSATSAKCGRFRHVLNGAVTFEQETYGLVGQLVVKTGTLGHYHAGLMGTVESNGGFHVGNSLACTAAVAGRPGGASITIDASCVLAGLAALSNVTAMTQTGKYVGVFVDVCSPGTSTPFGIGVYIPAAGATQGIVVETVPTSYLLPSVSVGVYGTPLVETALVDNIAFSVNLSTATNKTAADTSTMAAYVGVSNTAATTNNKLQGLLASCSVGYNCYDAYAVQGHTTVGAGGVSTQNANAHITGVSGKCVLTGAVGQGWVTGVLAIVEGAGAVTGLCHVIAAQVEATCGANAVDAILFLGADQTTPSAVEISDSAKLTNFVKFSASSGCVDEHSAGSAASGKQIIIDIGGSPYAIAVCAVGT